MTVAAPNAKGAGKVFIDSDEVRLAYDLGVVDLRAPIKMRFTDWADEVTLEQLGFEPELHTVLAGRGMKTAGDVVRALVNDRPMLTQELGLSGRALDEIREHLMLQQVRPDKLPQTGCSIRPSAACSSMCRCRNRCSSPTRSWTRRSSTTSSASATSCSDRRLPLRSSTRSSISASPTPPSRA